MLKIEGRTESSPSNDKEKKYITVDDLYRQSSQFEIWSFIPETLEQTRRQANQKGTRAATAKLEDTLAAFESENTDIYRTLKDELTPEKLLSVVSYDEEVRYLSFYSKNIIPTANFFKMPTQVKASAVSFFKKFYLVNSVMEYHPKNIMYTCVFLAAKSENYFISIDSFCKALKNTSAKEILDLEFIILQSLKFTLLVHHPFRPLYGFFLDFQAILLHPLPVMYDVSVDSIGELYDKSKLWLNDYALLSDVAFLFTPPQIALAAMYNVDRKITESYLKHKFLKTLQASNDDLKNSGTTEVDTENTQTTNENKSESEQQRRDHYEHLVRTIRKCIKLAKQIPDTTREESREIDRKCFYALKPKMLIEKKIRKLSSATT
ncbi:uncharacterized protein PRCAT00003646001 [Priceomyces carsonii]|uniref:uncharacterized protein n=1 Tax=Priceomyces carsonii TaxID=28549 RepID=UPI002EDB3887|nr:unnamed protein product [Priceomyces carsonii]